MHRKSHSSYSDDDHDSYASKSIRRSYNHEKNKNYGTNHKKSKPHESYAKSKTEDSFKESKAIAVLKGFFDGSAIIGAIKFSQTVINFSNIF